MPGKIRIFRNFENIIKYQQYEELSGILKMSWNICHTIKLCDPTIMISVLKSSNKPTNLQHFSNAFCTRLVHHWNLQIYFWTLLGGFICKGIGKVSTGALDLILVCNELIFLSASIAVDTEPRKSNIRRFISIWMQTFNF